MKKTLQRTLPLLAAGLLFGCTRSEPQTDDFLKNADLQMAQARAPACLPLSMTGDHASLLGALPTGWVAFGAKPTSTYGYGHASSTEQLERANALVVAGLLTKDDYQVYQDGQLAPVARFQFTDKGRAALRSSSAYGGSCLYAGKWVATGLVKPKAGESAMTKTENGETVSYMAEVQFALQDTPDWLKDPAVRAAFSQSLVEWASPRPQKVELVQFEGKWVAKKVLATKMMGEGGSERRAATKVAGADEEALLLRITDQANSRQRATLKLPVRASETPVDYARSHPGSFFFASTPDAKAGSTSNANNELLARLRMEQAMHSAAPVQVSPAQAQQTAKAAGRERDKYLTQRKELLEMLDVLTAAGAMVRTDVSAATAPTGLSAGVLYAPAAGVSVSENGLNLGLVQVKGPLEQSVQGSMLTLKASYVPLNPAPWLTKAAEQLPALKRRLQGGTLTALAVQGQGDTPQVMQVILD
jgi:hypothetical protein